MRMNLRASDTLDRWKAAAAAAAVKKAKASTGASVDREIHVVDVTAVACPPSDVSITLALSCSSIAHGTAGTDRMTAALCNHAFGLESHTTSTLPKYVQV